jgi:hypothetical protein
MAVDVLKLDGGVLQVRDKVVARSEIGFKVAACFKARDEAMVFFSVGIKNHRRLQSNSV